MNLHARIDGINLVQSNLQLAASNIIGATVESLGAGGELVRVTAQSKCPVDTGNLRASAFTVLKRDKRRWIMGGTKPAIDVLHEPDPVPDGHRDVPGETVARKQAVHETYMDLASMPGPNVAVGFGASYFAVVHERAFTRTGEPQFLANAVRQTEAACMTILARGAKQGLLTRLRGGIGRLWGGGQ